MNFYTASDTGRVRTQNEDFCYASDGKLGILSNLFVVCDGMGGHNAGEYASEGAVRLMTDAILRAEEAYDPYDALSIGIEAANRAIHQRSVDDPTKAGMGTTLVAATIFNSDLYVANVGDSRLYIFASGNLRQITRDHSYVEEMVRKGLINREEARHHRDRNKITRAVGVLNDVRIDFFDTPIEEGMQILLCTDGLTGMMHDEEIAGVLQTSADVRQKAETLIRMANEKGGTDNVTVILIEV